ncbi:LOW QUALITY PROTEIN: hypothetical protein RJ640_012790 [Escallonia rubra]|uniref:Uncharacterized protein n=1 Tax=Escallonia rubra TaxID=112253 RepID=A0AA88UTK6_9ASTE|nr:LOW QUALITY PROTEIN: hypothetical protein RJ640_012790 [Escallonia rubra]
MWSFLNCDILLRRTDSKSSRSSAQVHACEDYIQVLYLASSTWARQNFLIPIEEYLQNKDAMPGSELCTDGLICAFELVRGHRNSARPKSNLKSLSAENMKKEVPTCGKVEASAEKTNDKYLFDSTSLIKLDAGSVGDNKDTHGYQSGCLHTMDILEGGHWVPIGWARIFELVQTVQVNAGMDLTAV